MSDFDLESAESADPSAESAISTAALSAPPRPHSPTEVVEVGRRLNAIRDQMRGRFKSWLATAPYSPRSAFAWMAAARKADAAAGEYARPVFPMPSLDPTESGCASLSDEEIDDLALIAVQGARIDGEDDLEAFLRANRVAHFFGTAIVATPHATFAELAQAAARARCNLNLALQQVEIIEAMIRAQPADGVIGSCAFATKGTS